MRKAELNEFYDEWIQAIYRYTLSRVKHVDDAQDITSQTFLSAWQNRERYQERGEFAAWLFSIARNKIKDHSGKPNESRIASKRWAMMKFTNYPLNRSTKRLSLCARSSALYQKKTKN